MAQDTSKENGANQPLCNKLEDTSSLQSLLLEDKNAAWEKLHSRLQQKPRRIGRAWYWAAAACVLLVCSIPMFIANDKQGDPQNNPLKNTAVETAAQTIAAPEKKDTINSKGIIPNAEMLTIAIKPASTVKNIKAATGQMHTENISPVVVEQRDLPLTTTEIKSIENKKNEPIIVVAAPAKQKLRVIHINELGDATPERNTARNDDEGFIKFKIINQQVYNSKAATAKTIGFNISKLSSTN